MSPEEARKIVAAYGGVIADIADGDSYQDINSLPNSPAMIRYAYFVYTQEVLELGKLTEDLKNSLETTYALLDTRFIDEPEKLNKAFRLYGKSEKARQYVNSHGGLSGPMPSVAKMIEYHNFIVECQNNY